MRFVPTLVFALLLPCCAIAASPPAAPETATAMPAWEQLTPAQRETLVAPVRERWNENADERARMYQRAQRWHSMTPEQRKRAHRGKQRWDHMGPEQRLQARALYQKMRTMPPEQRHALRDEWKAMTPEQRRAWVERNPPQDD